MGRVLATIGVLIYYLPKVLSSIHSNFMLRIYTITVPQQQPLPVSVKPVRDRLSFGMFCMRYKYMYIVILLYVSVWTSH